MNTSKSLLDEILGIELKDVGTKVYKLIDVNQAKAAIVEAVEGLVDNSHPFPGAVVPNGWYEGWDAAKLQLRQAIKEWKGRKHE